MKTESPLLKCKVPHDNNNIQIKIKNKVHTI